MARTPAVFFDVDFTLIHPGRRFQAEGYQANCAQFGITVDCGRFEAAAGPATLCGVGVDISDRTGLAERIAPFRRGPRLEETVPGFWA